MSCSASTCRPGICGDWPTAYAPLQGHYPILDIDADYVLKSVEVIIRRKAWSVEASTEIPQPIRAASIKIPLDIPAGPLSSLYVELPVDVTTD